MVHRLEIGLRLGLLGSAALLLVACPNPNTYSTPRTAGSGRVNHSIAAEAWGFGFTDSATNTTVSTTLPTAPTYTVHVGLGDQFELGARIANMSSIGGDLKWNPIRSRTFDAAIDPGFQFFRIGTSDSTGNSASISATYIHLPVLLGLNLSKSVTLVASPGVAIGIISGSVTDSTSNRDSASATTGPLARFGVGADFRLTQGFALHPEVTLLHSFRDGATNLYMFGLGFNFGSLPSYNDYDQTAAPVAGGAPPPPAYPPPAPPPQ